MQADGVDYAMIGRVFLGLAPFLRTRLYGSAAALEPMFRELIGETIDVLVLFTKGTIESKIPGEINPRQSFLWSTPTGLIKPYDDFAQIAHELQVDVEGSKTIESIYSALRQNGSKFIPYSDMNLAKTVHLFVPPVQLAAQARVFLEIVQPYLEMYRNSTIHALNDLIRIRDSDLTDIVAEMVPSTAGTIRAILKRLSDRPRFGRHEATAWEFEVDTWHLRSEPAPTKKQKMETIELLANGTNRKLIGSGKVLAVDLGHCHTVVIPFSRLRDELMFRSTSAGGTQSVLKPVAPQRNLRSGDWAIVMRFPEPPHANVVHALIQYRQFYFDTFRPQLLEHIYQTIYDRASQVQSQYTVGSSTECMPDLWAALRELCAEVLPAIYQTLEVSGDVSVYRAAGHMLETIFTYDEPGARRREDVDCRFLSLRKGQRGIAAATFIEPEDNYVYCRDVDRLFRKDARMAEPIPAYIKLREGTRSEYCCKLRFKATPIGVINFESARTNGFGEAIQREISLIVRALEHYIREFLDAQDSHWLAITAAAYHNLHELRQQAMAGKWGSHSDRDRLLSAISAFDSTLDKGEGPLSELEEHFNQCLDAQLRHVPSFEREQMRSEAKSRTRFSLARRGSSSPKAIDRLRLELLKRITTNLMSNFDIAGNSDQYDSFKVSHAARPYECIRFCQEQEGGFPPAWIDSIGFAPLRDDIDGERAHHGLFLCGAIARSLGGFLWAGNLIDPDIGPQSVLEIVVPLYEKHS